MERLSRRQTEIHTFLEEVTNESSFHQRGLLSNRRRVWKRTKASLEKHAGPSLVQGWAVLLLMQPLPLT